MNFINKLKLNHKLILLASMPIIFMTGFALVSSFSSFSLYRTTIQLESMTNLGIHASSLVHELQKERGMTAGFLGSKGGKFVKEIIVQRQSVDEKEKILKQFLVDFDTSSIKINLGLKQALGQLKGIKNKRQAVSKQSIDLKEAIAYYTKLNALFLGLVSEVAIQSPNGEIAVMTAAYASFLQSKERAGIERAVLSNVFARDEFGELYDKFLSLIAAQENYMSVFLSLAKDKNIQFYKKTLQGKEIDEVFKMREIAKDYALSGGFDTDSAYWFKMSTGRIKRLKKVETYLSEKLLETTDELMSQSFNKFITSLIIALLGIIVSITIGSLVMIAIRKQVGGEPEYIEKVTKSIAHGDLSMELINTENASGIYAAMIKMRQRLSDVIEKDIQTIVDAARRGDLKQRINLQGKTGFYESLSEGINDVVEVSDNVIDDTVRVFSALADGNLNETITNEYKGSFNQLKNDANATINKINSIINGDIQSILNTAQAGNLGGRIELEGKNGFFLDLSSGINQLLSTIDDVFKNIKQAMESLSKGDLTKSMEGNYLGDFAQIQTAINSTTSNLLGIVGEIRVASGEISTAAKEISQGNTDLSQRTEEQASSLEETASSMEELTSTVRQNADNSRQANQLATNASAQANDGGQVIESTITAMDDISQSSRRIEDIIGVINEIAFQTNLLALNAAVEAARAGEQGRGFAVVASEVRNLAQRSAAAATEIRSLIKDSVEKVDEGTRLASDSGKTLSDIVNSVKKVSDIIAEIAASSSEQSQGIGQINQAITQLDEVTQQNAALVEQAAAASESMDEQASNMNNMVDFFSTGDNDVTNADRAPIARQAQPQSTISQAPLASAEKPLLSSAPVSKPSSTVDESEWEEF